MKPPQHPEKIALLNIPENLTQAWRLLKGSKAPLWSTSLGWISIAGAILLLAWFISFLLPPAVAFHPITLLSLTWVILLITSPLFAGINMIAIKRARGEPVTWRTGFQYFDLWLPLAGAFLAILLIITALILLFSFILNFAVFRFLSPEILNQWIPTVLLSIGTSILFNLISALVIFVIPLVADRKLPVFKALQLSSQIAKAHWVELFKLLILFYGLNLLTLLICEVPYIGLFCYIVINIWLFPFIFLNIGIAYHELVDRELIL